MKKEELIKQNRDLARENIGLQTKLAINKVMEPAKQRIILVMGDGSHYGLPDYTKWNKLAWYKKVWGFIFRRYKRKFIDMKGFSVKGLPIEKNICSPVMTNP